MFICDICETGSDVGPRDIHPTWLHRVNDPRRMWMDLLIISNSINRFWCILQTILESKTISKHPDRKFYSEKGSNSFQYSFSSRRNIGYWKAEKLMTNNLVKSWCMIRKIFIRLNQGFSHTPYYLVDTSFIFVFRHIIFVLPNTNFTVSIKFSQNILNIIKWKLLDYFQVNSTILIRLESIWGLLGLGLLVSN